MSPLRRKLIKQSVKEPSAVCVGVAGFSDRFKNSLFPFQNYYIA